MTEEAMPMTLPLAIGVEIDLLAHPLANLGEETGEAVLQGSLHMEKREMPMKVKGRLMVQVGEIQLEKESLQALLLVVGGILTEKEGLQLTVNMMTGALMEIEKSMLKGMI